MSGNSLWIFPTQKRKVLGDLLFGPLGLLADLAAVDDHDGLRGLASLRADGLHPLDLFEEKAKKGGCVVGVVRVRVG